MGEMEIKVPLPKMEEMEMYLIRIGKDSTSDFFKKVTVIELRTVNQLNLEEKVVTEEVED